MIKDINYGTFIGFTCSPFDLLHAGHIEMLRECKQYCDYLIVGLNINPCKQGRYPVQSVVERHIQLSGVSYVDEIIPYSTEEELISLLLLKNPDVRFVGDDYKDMHFTGDHLPIEIFYNKRNHAFSSAELKDRVVESRETEFIKGKTVVENEVYTIRDNEILDKLTVSSTTLAPGKFTKGHRHSDIDEVYHFISGEGRMFITSLDDVEEEHYAEPNKVFTIKAGEFHRVKNTSPEEDLVFICTFNSRRNH